MYYEENQKLAASQECTGSSSLGLRPRNPSVREKLLAQKEELEKYLSELTEALEALDKFPEFEKIHDLLAKIRM